MQWIKNNPKLVQATREFISLWENIPDPITAFAQQLKTKDLQLAWLLLGSSLFQGISYKNLLILLKNLHEKFPEEALFDFPLPKEDELLACLSPFLQTHWSLSKQFPGIFWSTGAFVRRHQTLSNWVIGRDTRSLWRDLGEIFYMGKGSVRPKVVQTLLRITMPFPRGLGLNPKPSAVKMNLPIFMGYRRWVGFLGLGRAVGYEGFEKKKKQAFLTSFLEKLYPENLQLASYGLQFFLEEGISDLICREKTDFCKLCPLSEFCPYTLVGDTHQS